MWKVTIILLCLSLLAGIIPQVFSQPRFTVGRNGVGSCPASASTNHKVIEALVSGSFQLADGIPRPSVTVIDTNIVCVATGLMRDTISSFSVVVSYNCSGRSLATCDGTTVVEQFQYECNSDNTFNEAVNSAGSIRTTNPSGNLSTPSNDLCGICAQPTAFVPADPTNHCLGML